ncbi:augmin complex subunit dgt3 [Culicoides brevitarsis]|uniref:augmin complex subunit dgt3 n=1 Tax=Culicoides brevitarsis TaxID=469753 RepID=UPI00307B5D07
MAPNLDSSNDILKKLGIDGENAQWMLATAPEFFQWIQENVSEENILSPAEIKEYEDLKKAGKLLSDKNLTEKLQEISNENPGIDDCCEEDLEIATKRVSELRKIVEKQKSAVEELSFTEKQQETKLEKVKLRLSDAEKETKASIESAGKVALELQAVEEENRKLYQDLQNSVNTPKIFTHQMPFYEHYNFIEEFIKELESYCEQNQILTAVSVVEENYDSKLGELQIAKDGFVNARYQEILLEMQIAAMEAVSQKVKSGAVQLPSDMNQLMSMMSEFSAVNEQKENQVSSLKQRILERINDLVLSQIELLSTKNIKFKHSRATSRIENINQLKPFVTKTIQMSEIIWFAINLDWERLNKDFSGDDFGACHSTHMRIQIMKRLVKGDVMPKNLQIAQDQTMKLISEVIGLNGVKISNVSEIIQAYSEFERDLSSSFKAVSEGIAAENFNKILPELQKIEKIYEKFVYGGTTAKPVLGDPRFTRKILKIKTKNKNYQAKYADLKAECKQLEDTSAHDKYYRYYTALWIWFLTEPMKVLQAIKEVKAATEKAPVHLSGLRRKN